MKVLGLNRKYLILLGVCSTSNANYQAAFKVVYFMVLVLQILGLISGVLFMATFLKSDLNGVLYSGFHTSAYSTSTYSLVVGFVYQNRILDIFQTLQCIYNEYHIKDSSNILSNVNEKCRWITMNFMRFLTLGYFVGSILLAMLSALYGYITVGSVDIDYLYVPFKFILPWDQHTVRGWIYETVFSVISSSLYLLTNVVFLTFFIGICEFHRASLQCFNVLVMKIENAGANDGSNVKTALCDTINFHITIKRFFWKTAHVFSLIILIQLVFVVLHMTFSVFQMDMAIKHPDLNFYMVFMSLLVSSANLYLYCYYGHRSTIDYAKMAQNSYESNWYKHPVELQKYFRMMIANAQRPLFYHGFQIVQLNLETYLKLLRSVISYYLMFKTFVAE